MKWEVGMRKSELNEGGSEKSECGKWKKMKPESGNWKEKVAGYGICSSDTLSQLSNFEFFDIVQ